MPGVEVVPSFMGITDVVLQGSGAALRSPAEIFGEIFWVFLGLGTAVGIVVIGYTLYNSYKYREGDGAGVDADVERPQLGELPSGSGGGKKLALSFSISAVIVVGLIIWTYSTLLYVEEPPDTEDSIEIDVIGSQFSWQFVYPNGETTTTLHAPADRMVYLNVTSRDVFHNFGIPSLRTKADAIPGQTSQTWFYTEAAGNYTVKCYELCGTGHSSMTAPVVIHNDSSFDQWYASTGGAEAANATAETNGTSNGSSAGNASGGSQHIVAPIAAGEST